MSKSIHAFVLTLVLISVGMTNAAFAADLGGDNSYFEYLEPMPVYDSNNSYFEYLSPENNSYYEYLSPENNSYYEYLSPESNSYYEYLSPENNSYFEYLSPAGGGCSFCGKGYSSGGSYGGGGYSSGGGKSTGGGYQISATPWSPGSPSTPKYPTTPSYPTGGGSSVSNTSVTNTTITNVDNSINDSFNNYNSNNVIAAATPAPQPVYLTPSCQIFQAQTSGGNSVYLSWTTMNATYAYLSNHGVANVPSGSATVWPTNTTTYILTVYGQNGTSGQCQVTVQSNAPYVALTQIPYTGFDFGTFGNAIYWASLVSFALGGAYLAIYFVPKMVGGSALALVAAAPRRTYAPVIAPMAPVMMEKIQAQEKIQPIVSDIANDVRWNGTSDTMAIVQSKDGSMPKIVINRS